MSSCLQGHCSLKLVGFFRILQIAPISISNRHLLFLLIAWMLLHCWQLKNDLIWFLHGCFALSGYAFCIYSETSTLFTMSAAKSIPQQFRVIVQPFQPCIFMPQMPIWMLCKQLFIKISQKSDGVPSSTLWQSYVCIEWHQLTIRRFPYIHHTMFNCLRLSMVIGKCISRCNGKLLPRDWCSFSIWCGHDKHSGQRCHGQNPGSQPIQSMSLHAIHGHQHIERRLLQSHYVHSFICYLLSFVKYYIHYVPTSTIREVQVCSDVERHHDLHAHCKFDLIG